MTPTTVLISFKRGRELIAQAAVPFRADPAEARRRAMLWAEAHDYFPYCDSVTIRSGGVFWGSSHGAEVTREWILHPEPLPLPDWITNPPVETP